MDRENAEGNIQMKSKKIHFGTIPVFAYIPLIIFIVPAFFSCTSFSVSEPVVIPEDFFGITPDGSPLLKEDAKLLDYFNAVWIRTTIRWTGVEPEEGKWVFEVWDDYVAKAEKAGKKLF